MEDSSSDIFVLFCRFFPPSLLEINTTFFAALLFVSQDVTHNTPETYNYTKQEYIHNNRTASCLVLTYCADFFPPNYCTFFAL